MSSSARNSPTERVPAGSALTVATITSEVDALAISSEWVKLAQECVAGPFAGPLFAMTWWRHLGQGTLLIITVRDRGQLVALAPLHVRRLGLIRVVRWLGHGLGTVAEALVLPGYLAAADALWREAISRRRVLDLLESREERSLPRPSSMPSGVSVSVAPRDACPVIDVHGDAATHLADPERRRVRRTVRVAQRRLAESGKTFRVEAAVDEKSMIELLPHVQQIFDTAEAERPRQHLLAGEWAQFTTAILLQGVRNAEVLVLVAFIDDSPSCFDVILLSGTTMSSWIGRFDPATARFSPGHLLQCAGLDWADAHGYDTVDLLLGDSYYKQLWADRSYQTLEVEAGSSLALSALHTVARLRARARGQRESATT